MKSLAKIADEWANALRAELVRLGIERPTVLVAVAGDGELHSEYGVQFRGSCLRIEGLAAVAARRAGDSWTPTHDQ